MSRPGDTRSRIICAAEDVVIRDGVAKLTLDAAAHEAGVSKGGVLYHFPTRAALVAAMVDRFVVSFDADLARRGCDGGRPGDFIRAYIDATISPTFEPGDPREQHLGAALLAGVASDPDLLEPLRARFASWQHSIAADGLDEALGTIMRLSCDGIWLCDLFGLAPVDGRLRTAIGQELRRLVDHSAGVASAGIASAGGSSTGIASAGGSSTDDAASVGTPPAPRRARAARNRTAAEKRPTDRSTGRRRQPPKETTSPLTERSRARS